MLKSCGINILISNFENIWLVLDHDSDMTWIYASSEPGRSDNYITVYIEIEKFHHFNPENIFLVVRDFLQCVQKILTQQDTTIRTTEKSLDIFNRNLIPNPVPFGISKAREFFLK